MYKREHNTLYNIFKRITVLFKEYFRAHQKKRSKHQKRHEKWEREIARQCRAREEIVEAEVIEAKVVEVEAIDIEDVDIEAIGDLEISVIQAEELETQNVPTVIKEEPTTTMAGRFADWEREWGQDGP